MSFKILDKTVTSKLNRNLEKAQSNSADSYEKLSSGTVFTSKDPRPAERALAEKLEFRLRGLTASKRNINDAVSLLQTAESGLAEISNIATRMKEINVAGSTTTLSDQERRYLFIEYQALYNEMERIARTTEFNGMPVLNGNDERAPEELVLRIDQPFTSADSEEDDVNLIRFDGFSDVVSTPEALGLRSAADLLADTDDQAGLSLDDVVELMEPEDSDEFATVYDQALNSISTQRAIYGALQTRLNSAMDYMDVYSENIQAAKSKISDTDYASELARLTENKILMAATTSLFSQSNATSSMALNLIQSAF
jgi:flagellin